MAEIFAQKNKRGGWNFCLKQINGVGGIFLLTFSKLVALLLTIAFTRVLKRLEYKTRSILVR